MKNVDINIRSWISGIDRLILSPITDVSSYFNENVSINIDTLTEAGFKVDDWSSALSQVQTDGNTFSNLLVNIQLQQSEIDQNFS